MHHTAPLVTSLHCITHGSSSFTDTTFFALRHETPFPEGSKLPLVRRTLGKRLRYLTTCTASSFPFLTFEGTFRFTRVCGDTDIPGYKESGSIYSSVTSTDTERASTSTPTAHDESTKCSRIPRGPANGRRRREGWKPEASRRAGDSVGRCSP